MPGQNLDWINLFTKRCEVTVYSCCLDGILLFSSVVADYTFINPLGNLSQPPPQKRKSFSEVVRPWNRAFLRKGSVWRLVLCFSVNELTAQDECSSCILTPSCKIIIYCIKPVSLIARFVYSELFLSNYPLFLFVCEKILSELARINKREKQVKMLFTLLFCILSQLVVLACYKPQSLQSLSHNA